MPDVDIDFFDRDGVLKLFKHKPVSYTHLTPADE